MIKELYIVGGTAEAKPDTLQIIATAGTKEEADRALLDQIRAGYITAGKVIRASKLDQM